MADGCVVCGCCLHLRVREHRETTPGDRTLPTARKGSDHDRGTAMEGWYTAQTEDEKVVQVAAGLEQRSPAS